MAWHSTFCLSEVEKTCPRYEKEIPSGSFVAVFHRTSLFGDNQDRLSFSLVGVAVLALFTDND